MESEQRLKPTGGAPGWVAFADASSDGTNSEESAPLSVPAPAAAAQTAPAAAPGATSGSKSSGGGLCSWLFDSSAISVARARGEGRFDENVTLHPPKMMTSEAIALEKESNTSPTASEVTSEGQATEGSVIVDADADADTFEDARDEEDAIVAHVVDALPPRVAALEIVAAELAAERSSSSSIGHLPSPGAVSSEISERSYRSTSSGEGGDSSRRRSRKKPPMGLPPTCLVDGVSAFPMLPPQPQHLGASNRHVLSGMSAPISAPLGRSSGTDDGRIFERQRRAEWVQDSGCAHCPQPTRHGPAVSAH